MKGTTKGTKMETMTATLKKNNIRHMCLFTNNTVEALVDAKRRLGATFVKSQTPWRGFVQ